MRPEQAVRTRLLSIGAVTAIVGQRIFVGKLPQTPTYPAIKVSLVDDIQDEQLRGPEGRGVARVQLDHYVNEATTPNPISKVDELEAATHGNGLGPSASGLAGYQGFTGGSPAFEFQHVRPMARLGPRYDAEELRIVTVSRDYLVRYVT